MHHMRDYPKTIPIAPLRALRQGAARSMRVIFLVATSTIVACGGDGGVPEGGGSGSIPPTSASAGFIAIGATTKSAPLEVNGITFATSNASVQIETNDDDGQGLQSGMIARVEATRTNTTSQPTATKVTSGAELRGTVESINRPTLTFSVLGIAVDVVSTTLYAGFDDGIASIRAGDSVQVHGYPSGDNRIRATLVKKRSTTQLLKITGTLRATACTTCTVPSSSFQIGALTVRPSSSAAPIDPSSSPLVDGVLVKATGSLDAQGVLIAESIVRYEGPQRVNGTGVVIQGVLANVSKAVDELVLSGITVRIDGNTQIVDNVRFGATFAPGNLLEITGEQRGGTTVATRILRL
jgi:Domain of unknown function (DUF5666)